MPSPPRGTAASWWSRCCWAAPSTPGSICPRSSPRPASGIRVSTWSRRTSSARTTVSCPRSARRSARPVSPGPTRAWASPCARSDPGAGTPMPPPRRSPRACCGARRGRGAARASPPPRRRRSSTPWRTCVPPVPARSCSPPWMLAPGLLWDRAAAAARAEFPEVVCSGTLADSPRRRVRGRRALPAVARARRGRVASHRLTPTDCLWRTPVLSAQTGLEARRHRHGHSTDSARDRRRGRRFGRLVLRGALGRVRRPDLR